MIRRMLQRRFTLANWITGLYNLLQGEIGLLEGSDGKYAKFKLGDGSSSWGSLPYFDSAPFAAAGGTADAITATVDPVPTLADGDELRVRASGANTATNPTFNPNGLGALTIYKKGGQALAVGDIFGAGHEITLRYRADPARWELVNPAVVGTTTDIAAVTHAATSKATPVDADEIPLVDSADSNLLKKLIWANLRTALKVFFDTQYAATAPADEYRFIEDMERGFQNSAANGTSFLTNSGTPVCYNSGAAAAGVYIASVAGHPGIVQCGTGTSNAGYSRMWAVSRPSFVVGGGEMILDVGFRIPVLSTAGERFDVSIALANAISSITRTIVARYRDDLNSGQWQILTVDSGGTTTVNTTAAPVANTWYTMRFVINAAGTSIEVFLNTAGAGFVSIATTTANIPTDPLGVYAGISKSVGTTSRTLDVDYEQVRQRFTTQR